MELMRETINCAGHVTSSGDERALGEEAARIAMVERRKTKKRKAGRRDLLLYKKKTTAFI